MLIVMKPDATENDVERVIEIIEKLGYKPHECPANPHRYRNYRQSRRG
jgi:hypothetical protein